MELLQCKKKTLNMAEVLMGQYQMTLKIWGEVVHWIQLAQDQISCRFCQSSMNLRTLQKGRQYVI
jgi:hypothetical protein